MTVPVETVQPLNSRTALLAVAKLVSLGFPIIWLRSPTQKVRFTEKGEVELPIEKRGKIPVAEGWQTGDALQQDHLVEMWGEGEPGYNIGIRCGVVSGCTTNVIVVDLDSEIAVNWATENLPPTEIMVRSSKGQHWYYRCPSIHVGNKVRVRIGADILPLDIRGKGGQVVAPSSIHGTGHRYSGILPWTPERVASMPIFDPKWFGKTAEWEGGEDPAIAEGAARVPPLYVEASRKRKRALAYLEHTPGTVSGQGVASNECLYYARALVFGFCINPADAAQIMFQSEWNNRCTNSKGELYRWELEELLHKCEDAYRLKFTKPYGYLLLEDDKKEKNNPGPPNGLTKGAREMDAYAKEIQEQERESNWWDFQVEEQEVKDPAKNRWPLTDTGNAERLVARFGESIRFVEDRRVWFAWDKETGRWVLRSIALERASKTVARKVAEEFPAAEDWVASATAAAQAAEKGPTEEAEKAKKTAEAAADSLDKLQKWQKASEAAGKRAAMIELAGSEPSVAVGSDMFDRHSMLLNVRNGTLDLKAGRPTLLRHNRDLYFTKTCMVNWEEKAEAPTWRRCLDQWMSHDQELIDFLQRAAGYSLTGSTEEECFFIFCGVGQNGKSTYLNALQAVLGPYATAAPAGLLMETRIDKATPSQQAGLASLVGTRLVVASETDESAYLSEAQVKSITCRDKVSAKRMYEAPFEFQPNHHVYLMTNAKPGISGTDDGIWRRVHLIEWKNKIAQADRDNKLAEKLMAERPGILRWAVEGCAAWKERGLDPPPAVRDALRKYREEQDTVGAFTDELLSQDPNGKIPKQQMYSAYETWCETNGATKFGQKRFTQELVRRGATEERTAQARIWAGFTFKSGMN